MQPVLLCGAPSWSVLSVFPLLKQSMWIEHGAAPSDPICGSTRRNEGSRYYILEPNSYTVYFKAFEDSSGALEMAQMPRMSPRTKYINVAYHRFCSHVVEGKISVHAIGMADKICNSCTKPLGVELFASFTKLAFGWDFRSFSVV
jgi:hypothetical protein